MVSGRYFFPNAPVLCLKWMPAWAVTSVNSIGPEGRGGSRYSVAGAGGGSVTGAGAAGGELAAGCGAGSFLRGSGGLLLAASQCQQSEER